MSCIIAPLRDVPILCRVEFWADEYIHHFASLLDVAGFGANAIPLGPRKGAAAANGSVGNVGAAEASDLPTTPPGSPDARAGDGRRADGARSDDDNDEDWRVRALNRERSRSRGRGRSSSPDEAEAAAAAATAGRGGRGGRGGGQWRGRGGGVARGAGGVPAPQTVTGGYMRPGMPGGMMNAAMLAQMAQMAAQMQMQMGAQSTTPALPAGAYQHQRAPYNLNPPRGRGV